MDPWPLRRPSLVELAALLLIGFGLFVSCRYAFGFWRADPDVFVTVQIWRGVRQFGPEFLTTWSYTQDNWLFSLIPFTSLLFEGFGAGLATAVFPGWMIFVSSVALTSWLAYRLAGLRVALVLAAVLLFANFWAIGRASFLGYPISHNLSMAWVLLTLVVAVRALERQSAIAAVAAAVLVFINLVSDPWAAVAIAGPLTAVSGVVAFLNRGTALGRIAALLSAATAIAFLLAYTRVFGLLSFLPKSHFRLADLDIMRLNLGWAQRSLGTTFNIIPGADLQTTPPRLFGALSAAVLIGWAMLLTAKDLVRAGVGRQLVAGVAVLSIVGMCVLFVVSRFPPDLGVGRFFPHVYYLGGLLVALVAAERWARWSLAPKAAITAYGALFVLAGVLSAPDVWMGQRKPAGHERALELAAVLQARGLSYGYGPFWGTDSLVMDTLTDGRVTIRPVSFMTGRVRRRPAQTSSLWYTPRAEPQGDQRRFVIAMNDGEECPVVETCVQAALRQFGPPTERFEHGEAVILVWPRPLAPQIDP